METVNIMCILCECVILECSLDLTGCKVADDSTFHEGGGVLK